MISAARKRAGVGVFDNCTACQNLRKGVSESKKLLGVKNIDEFCEKLMVKAARRKQLLVPPPNTHDQNIRIAKSDFDSIVWEAEHPRTFLEKVAVYF